MHSDTESYKCGRCSCSPLPLKEALKTIAPDGVERAETDGAVSVDIMEELEQPVLPEQRTLVLVETEVSVSADVTIRSGSAPQFPEKAVTALTQEIG